MSRRILKPDLLCSAYAQGFFPMPDPDTGKIVWLQPDPRAILPLNGFHCSRRLARRLRQQEFQFSVDQDFEGVMRGCARREEGTWITDEFLEAYKGMHDAGLAHSVEVRKYSKLVGGLYGVALNGAFFAESKFYTATDASKAALYYLVRHLNERGFKLLEVQFLTPHLETLGVVEIPGESYLKLLAEALATETSF